MLAHEALVRFFPQKNWSTFFGGPFARTLVGKGKAIITPGIQKYKKRVLLNWLQLYEGIIWDKEELML